jgi:hypothetical protein
VYAQESNQARADRLEALLLAGLPTQQALDDEVEAGDVALVTPVPGSGPDDQTLAGLSDPEWHPVWSKDFVKRGEGYLGRLTAERAKAGLK